MAIQFECNLLLSKSGTIQADGAAEPFYTRRARGAEIVQLSARKFGIITDVQVAVTSLPEVNYCFVAKGSVMMDAEGKSVVVHEFTVVKEKCQPGSKGPAIPGKIQRQYPRVVKMKEMPNGLLPR